MMITPKQIKEKVLSTAQQGYDIDETNAFLNEIAESYSAVYAENKELYRKLEILAQKVEEYRDDEDTIKAAVITAQKAADGLKKSAREKSEKLMRESASSAQRTVLAAKEKAEKLISEARNYASSITKEKAAAANEIINEAEQKANSALRSARVLAQDIVDKAQTTSDEIITNASSKKEYYDELTSKLKAEAGTFKNSLVSLYETQLEKLHEMMEAAEAEAPAAAQEDSADLKAEIDGIFSQLGDIDASEYKENTQAPGEYNEHEEYETEQSQDAQEEQDEQEPQTEAGQPQDAADGIAAAGDSTAEYAPEAPEEATDEPTGATEPAQEYEEQPQATAEAGSEDANAPAPADEAAVNSAIDAFSSDSYSPVQEIHIGDS
ncbi:MAG: DivIVA domain-containing protein, partial [Clostridiales bacterium]|nr:DivIVA domain-containing protein [Clostridiales bacterium]